LMKIVDFIKNEKTLWIVGAFAPTVDNI
jgi:hypothetical protein